MAPFRKGSLARKTFMGSMKARKISKAGSRAVRGAKSKVGAAKGKLSGFMKRIRGGRMRPMKMGRRALKMSPMQMSKKFR